MDALKILLVEDEPYMISLIKRGVGGDGYEFDIAMHGLEALKLATTNNYNLIILDIMLQGMSGLEVCRAIRKTNTSTPIMILSALDSARDIVAGFDSMADDYMTKPFELEVLKARIKALIRRSETRFFDNNTIVVGNLSVNTETKEVIRNNKVIMLTATEFRLLVYLMKNRRKILPRLDILENVWGEHFSLETNVVDVYINYLRRKIDKHFSVKLIHTVIGMGYIIKEE
jgi:two-component system copper resistance phosphate regulon response regulator CusR